jgi:hypothetical protein
MGVSSFWCKEQEYPERTFVPQKLSAPGRLTDLPLR